jgi:glycosyltransferase involved in cell wall biosynthesis
MRRAIIHWGISSFFGWGVYGLNLALHWAGDPDVEAFCSFAIGEDQISVDRLRRRALDPFVRRSNALLAELAGRAGRTLAVDSPVLCALGNDFRSTPAAHGVRLAGAPDVGVVFFEMPQLDAETVARAKAFPLIVAGSTWNEQILREYGVDNVVTVIQGIDPTLFHPAPRLGKYADRFLVFSGGKLELRKGQDLVVAAFAEFAKRHPEALLVTAWHSPWPQFARTLDHSRRAAPIVFDAAGKTVDAGAWARANGIPESQFLDLGAVPNAFMPPILREMDVALFPNRSEGGTNLVAMECMACGVPTILSANTGHLDLIEDGVCLPLRAQSAVAGAGAGVGGTAGWGESSVEEIVETLERVHADRAAARTIGLAGAEKLAGFTWAATAAAMKRIVLDLA